MAETLLQQVLVWVGAVVLAFVVYRFLFGGKETESDKYDRQIDKILTSEKYKVKGRFD
jgi:hypothetical protein